MFSRCHGSFKITHQQNWRKKNYNRRRKLYHEILIDNTLRYHNNCSCCNSSSYLRTQHFPIKNVGVNFKFKPWVTTSSKFFKLVATAHSSRRCHALTQKYEILRIGHIFHLVVHVPFWLKAGDRKLHFFSLFFVLLDYYGKCCMLLGTEKNTHYTVQYLQQI